MMYTEGAVKQVRSVCRLPLSQRWDGEKLEKIDVSHQGMHSGREARAVHVTQRDPDESEAHRGRHARRLELRQ